MKLALTTGLQLVCRKQRGECMATPKDSIRTIVNEDGAALLDTSSGSLTTLNSTGAFIWQALEQGEDEPTILARLADETGEPPDRIAQDVSGFLAALRRQHLWLV
jgi:hypothetical protein